MERTDPRGRAAPHVGSGPPAAGLEGRDRRGPSHQVDPASLAWRILRDPPLDGPTNMALDAALAQASRPSEAVLRIYRWSRPTLSLGRNQRARERFDPLAARGMGVEIVRRPTGGREVLHDRELTWSVVLPVGVFGGLRESYRALNLSLVEALRSLGVGAALAEPGGRISPVDAGACFGEPATDEVTVGGRKIAGSAQRRFGAVLLQHGSLLLGPPSVPLDALRVPDAGDPAPSSRNAGNSGPITLGDLVDGPVGFPRVAAAVEAAMAGALGGRWRRGEPNGEERRVASELRAHYESAGWTWRR